jgi:ribosome maturation protein SDO1
MVETKARITRGGKHFEILVDLEEALKFRKEGVGNINTIVLTRDIHNNLKVGDKASNEQLEKEFGTSNFEEVCVKIIKSGEIVMPTDYVKKEHEQKYKQVVDFLVKNAVDSSSGRPYTPNTILNALEEAKVNIKNKPVESQISEILDQLKRIIPIHVELKKVKLTIPANQTGKAYGIFKEFIEKENWMSNGDLEVILNIPAGIIFDFYDKINSATHGNVVSEEMK